MPARPLVRTRCLIRSFVGRSVARFLLTSTAPYAPTAARPPTAAPCSSSCPVAASGLDRHRASLLAPPDASYVSERGSRLASRRRIERQSKRVGCLVLYHYAVESYWPSTDALAMMHRLYLQVSGSLASPVAATKRPMPSALVCRLFFVCAQSCSGAFLPKPRRCRSGDARRVRRRVAELAAACTQVVQHNSCLAQPSVDPRTLSENFVRCLDRVSSRLLKPVWVVVDNVHAMGEPEAKLDWLLDPLPINVRVIVSTTKPRCPQQWRCAHVSPVVSAPQRSSRHRFRSPSIASSISASGLLSIMCARRSDQFPRPFFNSLPTSQLCLASRLPPPSHCFLAPVCFAWHGGHDLRVGDSIDRSIERADN